MAHVIFAFIRKQSNCHSFQASLTAFVISIIGLHAQGLYYKAFRTLTSIKAPQVLGDA